MSVSYAWELAFDAGAVEAAIAAGSDRSAYAVGEHVLQVSNTVVPLEEGDLERSGAVSDPEDGSVDITYNTPYATRQHENLTYSHAAGRRAKYLESTLASERRSALQIVAREMRL